MTLAAVKHLSLGVTSRGWSKGIPGLSVSHLHCSYRRILAILTCTEPHALTSQRPKLYSFPAVGSYRFSPTLQAANPMAAFNNRNLHSYTNLTKLCSIYGCHSFNSQRVRKLLQTKKLLEILWSSNFKRSHMTASKFTVDSPVYMSYLESLCEEYAQLNADISDQQNKVDAKSREYQLMRLNFLRSVVEVIQKVKEKQGELKELSSMMSGEEDKEMKAMVAKEMEKYKAEIVELEEELIDVLVGAEPADNNDIILEVAAGVGGQEAMLFCAEIYNMYCNYAVRKGWTLSEVVNDESDLGGSRKATVEIRGQDVYKLLKYEGGVHRVQRVPKTEKAGRVHTSTITVSVLPQPGEIEIDIRPDDLKIDTFRNSGPGGQSVNTTDSAVRITHIPTGTVSECRQERSQLKNRDIAMKNLRNKIYQSILEEQEVKRRTARKMQMGTRARSEKIRTYNYQQDRVTDHRLKENCSNLAGFMLEGEGLDDLISSLYQVDKLQTLEAMLEEYETELSKQKSGKR